GYVGGSRPNRYYTPSATRTAPRHATRKRRHEKVPEACIYRPRIPRRSAWHCLYCSDYGRIFHLPILTFLKIIQYLYICSFRHLCDRFLSGNFSFLRAFTHDSRLLAKLPEDLN
ncbi:hypothetical protein PFISCL1PPCAC_16936, partial [Pristionchus fissidentatus]